MSVVDTIEAVVFDFDGVIADTEPLHHRAFCAIVEPDGLACSWEEYLADYIGFDDRDLFREAYRKNGRILSDEELRHRIQAKAEAFIALTSEGVTPYDGIPDVIHALADQYPLALCSGALQSDIEPILKQLGLTSCFVTRVTAEDVPVSKPDPACYRLVVQRLSAELGHAIAPSSCLAIEDTPAGVQAAQGAGLLVWAVPHTHDAASVAQADRVLDSLHDILPLLGGAST